jgi:hypothetical protein
MNAEGRAKVGVSIFVRKGGGQSMWENGIFQNCLFLVMLLLRSPRVEACCLVAGGSDGTPEDAATFLADSPVPVIDMQAAARELDLVIEMSAQLDREWVVAFRAKGGKIVSMRVGNDYVIDIERMIFDKPHGLLLTGAPYHAIWTLPEYENTCVPYFASAFRAPVSIVPHLWSPLVLDRAIADANASQDAHGGEGVRFGYRPGRRRWRIGIFEPNVCMVKTSHMPLLCCEVAHRSHPDALAHVFAYNTFHMKAQPTFNAFALELDIVRHGIASFEGRFPIWRTLTSDVDAVVSHHWENGQNYVYYEALYGGYPLVHNSHLIDDCGYRYQGFDCEEGGAALLRAWAQHDGDLDGYRARARRFLATLDPEAPHNVRIYTEAIDRVLGASTNA